MNKGLGAWTYGAHWGFGHGNAHISWFDQLGIGMVAFGVMVYILKMFLPFNIEVISTWLDLAVGISLILVGAMGIKEVNTEKKKLVTFLSLLTTRKRNTLPLHFNRASALEASPKPSSVSLLTGIWQGT